jgi:hypothetical protein
MMRLSVRSLKRPPSWPAKHRPRLLLKRSFLCSALDFASPSPFEVSESEHPP